MDNILILKLQEKGYPLPQEEVTTAKYTRWGKSKEFFAIELKDGSGYYLGNYKEPNSAAVIFKNSSNKPDQKIIQKAQRQLAKEIKTEQEEVSNACTKYWESMPALKNHAYLTKKRIKPYGLKEYSNNIVIPVQDTTGKIWSFQYIAEDGRKHFKAGGRKSGCFYPIGCSVEDLKTMKNIYVCEGYATGATIFECTKIPVIIAFDAGNLKNVVYEINKKFKKLKITICADNDCYNENGINTGVEKATEAIKGLNADMVIPRFKDHTTHPTDFNDLFMLEGVESVKKCLLDGLKDISDNKRDIPEGFELSDEGLFAFDKNAKELVRISNYIKVTASVRDNESFSKLIEFKDKKNKLKQIIAKAQMLTRNGEQLRVKLVEQNFIYKGDIFSKHKLFEYFVSSNPNKDISLVSKTGFYENVYIRPNHIIGKPKDKIVTDGAMKDRSYRISGTLEEWNNNVVKPCISSSRLMFAIDTAFASLLITPCHMPNFGFHFVGNSSSGKTTALKVAASVFGNHRYVSTWKATDNALENVAYRRNDSLLVLDELSEVSPAKAGDIAYMLANGEGKKRMDKDCNERDTLSWNLIFLSSGEIDLASHMAEADKTTKAGQKIRFLNIPIKTNEKSFGIFENLGTFQDGAEFSDYLQDMTDQYHGTASIAFIEKILADKRDFKKLFRWKYEEMKAKYLPKEASGQDMRAFEYFSFVAFAGELATESGIVQRKLGISEKSAMNCFNSWLKHKGGSGDDEGKQVLNQVKSFLELHGKSRFYDLNGNKDQKVINMAGYRKIENGNAVFWISPTVFQQEVCKGFDRTAVIDLLIEKGFLLLDSKGEYRQQKWTKEGNRKVYVISGHILS